MVDGIAYVCFGKTFDNTLAHACVITRKYTELPIVVFTNIKNRSEKWKDVSDVEFIYFDMEDKENREIKTQLPHHTPFDNTLYLDSDTVIQKEGIEQSFVPLQNGYDICVNPEFMIQQDGQTFNIYNKTIQKLECPLPLVVVSGGYLCFTKSDKVKEFFDTWNKNWKTMGSGREMPSLACALRVSDLKISSILNMYEPNVENEDVIVQHNWGWGGGGSLYDKFSLPTPEQNKSFDTNVSDDWRLVNV